MAAHMLNQRYFNILQITLHRPLWRTYWNFLLEQVKSLQWVLNRRQALGFGLMLGQRQTHATTACFCLCSQKCVKQVSHMIFSRQTWTRLCWIAQALALHDVPNIGMWHRSGCYKTSHFKVAVKASVKKNQCHEMTGKQASRYTLSCRLQISSQIWV